MTIVTTLDAASLRSWLLSLTATYWAVGIPMGPITDDLPAAEPLLLAEEACRIAEAEEIDQWPEIL